MDNANLAMPVETLDSDRNLEALCELREPHSQFAISIQQTPARNRLLCARRKFTPSGVSGGCLACLGLLGCLGRAWPPC
jgi:hypothetical protein